MVLLTSNSYLGFGNRFYGDNGHHGRLHDVFVLAIYMFSNMQSQCFYYFFPKIVQ